jgi:hypothetical protein
VGLTDRKIQIEGAFPMANGQQQRGGGEGSSNKPVMQVYLRKKTHFWVMVHGISHAKKNHE